MESATSSYQFEDQCECDSFASFADAEISRAREACGIEVVPPFMAKTEPPSGAEVVALGGVIFGYKHKPKKHFDDRCFRSLRTRELNKLAMLRHRLRPPSEPEARALATAMASVAEPKLSTRWIRKWCISLDPAEQDEVIADAVRNPRRYTAAAFGTLVALTRDERATLKITTFRAAGVTKKEMKAERKRKDAERKRKKRAEARFGKPPSLAKLEPWVRLGISESTFKRWRKKAKALIDARAGCDCNPSVNPKVSAADSFPWVGRF